MLIIVPFWNVVILHMSAPCQGIVWVNVAVINK